MSLGFRMLSLALVLSQAACSSLSYVEQASAGQYDLLTRARDIDELIRERHVDGRTRALLSHVADIKRFGEVHGLTATDNYRSYVRLDRPYVVWVTSAAEPLRFKSRSWSFPLVGSFEYLGWFRRDAAYDFAGKLAADGFDVDVRGSSAYSTTGYFEDAVLSTMIRDGRAALGEMTNTILHEMTHATFFVRNQSTLNESVANFVGNTLADHYLSEHVGDETDEALAYREHERELHERGRALQEAYRDLEALYASPMEDARKLALKKDYLVKLRDRVHLSRPISNATLIQYKTYNSGQDELAALLAACGGDFPRFIARLRILKSKDLPKAQEKEISNILVPLLRSNCP